MYRLFIIAATAMNQMKYLTCANQEGEDLDYLQKVVASGVDGQIAVEEEVREQLRGDAHRVAHEGVVGEPLGRLVG